MNRLFGNSVHLLRALLFIMVQIILFNKLTLFDIARPFPYLIVILYLPIRLQRWQGLLAAFSIGFVIDIFNYTHGIHASSMLLMYFLRDFYLHSILGVTEEETGKEPHIYTLGPSTFLLYLLGMVFIHHLSIAILDELDFGKTLLILIRTFVNSFFTILVLLVIEIIFFYKRGRSN
ncbi:MAG: rod shape-determining protein MreD [Bacteroidia bacterium]